MCYAVHISLYNHSIQKPMYKLLTQMYAYYELVPVRDVLFIHSVLADILNVYVVDKWGVHLHNYTYTQFT